MRVAEDMYIKSCNQQRNSCSNMMVSSCNCEVWCQRQCSMETTIHQDELFDQDGMDLYFAPLHDRHASPVEVRAACTPSKSVTFSELHVREYNLEIGSHPCCLNGPPLSLGWEYNKLAPISVDDYEFVRTNDITMKRRKGRELVLSSYERRNMLRNISGFTDLDFRKLRDKSSQHKSLSTRLRTSASRQDLSSYW